MTSPKIAIIQLDSADAAFLRQHREALPTITRLLEEGGETPLLAEPFAGSNNMTFNTGCRPQAHGVFFQLQWDPEEMRLRSLAPDWVGDLTPFWRRGKMGEKRGIVIDPPFTFKAQEVPGIEVLGWNPHSGLGSYACTDAAEGRRIAREYGVNIIGDERRMSRDVSLLEAERDQMIASATARARLACDLMATRDWDFLYLVFGEPHRAGHVLWPKPGATPEDGMLDVMKAVDTALGAVLDALPTDAHIIAFAAQGMEHQSCQSHFCRPLLEKALGALGFGDPEHGARPGLVAWLRGQIPQRLQWAIRERIPMSWRDAVVAREYAAGIVPGETVAFPMMSDNHGYWRLLVSGREAQGTLSEEEAGRFRADFAEIIAGFRTPEGEPLVTDVLFPSTEAGERSHLLPDVVAAWNPEIHPAAEATHPKLGTIRGTPDLARSGNHRFRAFWVHKGPEAAERSKPERVADLAEYIEALTA
ncbi:MAG: alkaline phosphatase family protein [Pseudomonadota bacterium]